MILATVMSERGQGVGDMAERFVAVSLASLTAQKLACVLACAMMTSVAWRRGYTPEALRLFCERVGESRLASWGSCRFVRSASELGEKSWRALLLCSVAR